MSMNDSGIYRKHLSGEAAFCSFIPLSLQEAVERKETDQIRWSKSDAIARVVEKTGGRICQFQEMWRNLEPEKQECLKKHLLRQESEASVCMAYPREGGFLSGFGFAEVAQTGNFSSENADLRYQDRVDSFLSGQQMQQVFFAWEPAKPPDSPLDRVPGEFRGMAEEDVENLYQASEESLEMLNSLPLSGRLLKELHYMVMYASHYDKMYRGEFRRSPVWIGAGGQDLRAAEFVPPVGEDMLQAFSDLESFLHYEEMVPPLVKAALIHYQFETIHPFIDGNGRIGRMLTLLYLKEALDLECPWFPLSAVLLRGMDRYYKEIRTLQLYGNYERWTLWFLGMLDEAIKNALRTG